MKLHARVDDDTMDIISAEQAARRHKPGDRYIDPDTGKWVQLHIGYRMRSHFEFMRNQEPS